MKRYLIILFAGVFLGLAPDSKAQDIHFSQFSEISTLRNPGLTGIFTGDYKVGLDYRTQWAEVSTPYSTVAFSGETRLLVDRVLGDYLSFGLNVTYDKAGSINFVTEEIYPAVCFNKSMEDDHNTYVSVGLAGGYFSRSVDMSKMTFSSQYTNRSFDPNNPSFENTPFNKLSNYDVGAGVSLSSSFDMESVSNYYLGAALFHINHPTEIFYGPQVLVKLPLKWEFNAGFHINLTQQFGFTLQGNYSYMNPYSELIAGGLLTWRNSPIRHPSNFSFSFGAYYRYQDAIIPMVKLDFQNVAVAVSYDVNNSKLSSYVSGSSATEITIFVRGVYNHRRDFRDDVICPKFEDNVYSPFK